VNEELVATDTLATYNEELVDTDTLAAYNEELVTADTLATNSGELAAVATLAAHDKELVAADTLATDDEEFDATMTLAAIKTYVNVELAEKYLIVKNVKTAQNAKSQFAIDTGVNILENIKNNYAKPKKIAVKVSSVEAEIEEFSVEQTKAGTNALTSPQNTKNYVDVMTAKRTQVEKVAKTTLAHYDEEFATIFALATNGKEFADTALANYDEKFAAALATYDEESRCHHPRPL
jgi:hypothetical protein